MSERQKPKIIVLLVIVVAMGAGAAWVWRPKAPDAPSDDSNTSRAMQRLSQPGEHDQALKAWLDENNADDLSESEVAALILEFERDHEAADPDADLPDPRMTVED